MENLDFTTTKLICNKPEELTIAQEGLDESIFYEIVVECRRAGGNIAYGLSAFETTFIEPLMATGRLVPKMTEDEENKTVTYIFPCGGSSVSVTFDLNIAEGGLQKAAIMSAMERYNNLVPKKPKTGHSLAKEDSEMGKC